MSRGLLVLCLFVFVFLLMSIAHSFSDVAGLTGGNDVWIHGTVGTLHIDLAGARVRFGKQLDSGLHDITHEIADSKAGWNVEREFVGAIRGENIVKLTDFETGHNYMMFTDAVHKAVETGNTVVVV